ncbi:MAG TPA: hypothetical protein VGN48_17740 [Pedococcus sp.]|jgi:hypothetical protein|nr:hypothetical protein [Pedococcus sp.]
MASRRIVAASALAISAFGLIGAGASAQFTELTPLKEHITAGTLDIALSSRAPGSVVTARGKKLTFASVGPTNATFTTGAQPMRFTNSGSIAAHSIVVAAAPLPAFATRTSAAFEQQVCVHLVVEGATLYDGPLRRMQPSLRALTVPAHTSVPATVEFYAGHGTCPALTPSAMGGSITPGFRATFSD